MSEFEDLPKRFLLGIVATLLAIAVLAAIAVSWYLNYGV